MLYVRRILTKLCMRLQKCRVTLSSGSERRLFLVRTYYYAHMNVLLKKRPSGLGSRLTNQSFGPNTNGYIVGEFLALISLCEQKETIKFSRGTDDFFPDFCTLPPRRPECTQVPEGERIAKRRGGNINTSYLPDNSKRHSVLFCHCCVIFHWRKKKSDSERIYQNVRKSPFVRMGKRGSSPLFHPAALIFSPPPSHGKKIES